MPDSIPVPPMGNTFQAPTMKYIQSIYNQFAGAREEALADLTVYLQNPVGVGEHADIGEEIKRKIRQIEEYDSLVDCISRHFGPAQQQQEKENKDPSQTP